MAFEATEWNTQANNEKVLGRFRTESLNFLILHSDSSVFCEEEKTHFRVPIFLPQNVPSAGSPEAWQSFFGFCFCRFAERVGLQVFPKFAGGSSSPTRVDPIQYGWNKAQCSDDNQSLACEIAGEVLQDASNGVTEHMRLAQLEDIPQVTIKAPIAIAKMLIDALHQDALWSTSGNFLVRATIARLARRNMMDHIMLNKVAYFKSTNDELNRTIKEILCIAKKRDKEWLESGVILQCEIIQMLIKAADSTEEWWRKIPPAAKILFEAYTSRNPLTLLPLATEVWQRVSSLAGQKRVIEFQLQVDNIYWALGNPSSVDEAVRCMGELLDVRLAWEKVYTVLACLEWGIHRDKFTDAHINLLRPQIEALVALPSRSINPLSKPAKWRLCEKVATILIKLQPKHLHEDLLWKMNAEKMTEHEKRVILILDLRPEMLCVEPRLHVSEDRTNSETSTSASPETKEDLPLRKKLVVEPFPVQDDAAYSYEEESIPVQNGRDDDFDDSPRNHCDSKGFFDSRDLESSDNPEVSRSYYDTRDCYASKVPDAAEDYYDSRDIRDTGDPREQTYSSDSDDSDYYRY